MQRAQVSAELLAVFGIFLLFLLVFSIFSSGFILDLFMQEEEKQARSAVESLKESAERVYAMGEGTTELVSITLPPNTVFGSESTFIGKPPSAPLSVPSNMINIRVKNSDIFAYTQAPLIGSFPNSTGIHTINVTSHGSYVSIGSPLVLVNPSALYLSTRSNSSVFSNMTIKVISTIRLTHVNISYSWPHQNTNLTIHPTNFISSGPVVAQIRLNFTANNLSAGIYTSQVRIVASEIGGTQVQTIAVPITAEVKV
ncbi:MAG: hypothetical protein N3G22_04030 [Candidatus Micrarchaeota archaeon]|nr:hypothetical protein [Candidatus Micrarchaeota archaeon]